VVEARRRPLEAGAIRAAHTVALEHMHAGRVVGVGSGPLVERLISALAGGGSEPRTLVAASSSTASWLETLGLPAIDLPEVDELDYFVTEPREFTADLSHVLASGPALTAERVLAATARRYICLAVGSGEVRILGKAAVPVEVVPMARRYVAGELARLGGVVLPRTDVVNESGNLLLEVRDLDLRDPHGIERKLDIMPGVVGHGICAHRRADAVVVQDGDTVRELGLD
jgi:ribose 5-phosphate isomerase A